MTEIITILYNIRSVHNVASIFRTADGAGISKIYLCGITPTPLDRNGIVRRQFKKVSLGAEQNIVWEKIGSSTSPRPVVTLIKKLRNEGWRIFAVEQSKNSTLYYKFNTSYVVGRRKIEKMGIVTGNEVKGLPPSIMKACDETLEIPMLGKKESLNVSVAFGIVAYHLRFGIIKSKL